MGLVSPYAESDCSYDDTLYEDVRAICDPIHAALEDINTSGSFAASGLLFPVDLIDASLAVEGVGLVNLPLSSSVAHQLMQQSQQALYGQGNRTLTDLTDLGN
jgi:hypothetical protein